MPWFALFWAVFAVVFLFEWRWMRRGRGATSARVRDHGSRRVIYWVMGVAVAIAFWCSYPVNVLALTWHPYDLFFAGLALMVAGELLRQWAMSALGRHFTSLVAIQPGHELIETGLYRYVRHPSYTGAFLLWIGLGLALNNGVSLIVLALAATIAYGERVRSEEAALKEAFGDSYRSYCRRTRRFIPWLF
jgi:protein-S-isoprenylcysteine O-methyltransferase